MRRFSEFLILSIVVSACGGPGGDPIAPGPPNPPPGAQIGPPASVTVSAGDNQTGEPGQVLGTRVRALVKDSLGRAVPNAPVQFAVDSGGGTIDGVSATTGADGQATAGDWTLGAAEGRNILQITVAGAPAVRASATATYLGVSVSAGSIGGDGGSLVIQRPGSALDRLRITAPASAFASAVAFTVTASSSAGLILNPAAVPNRFTPSSRSAAASSRSTSLKNDAPAALNLLPEAFVAVTPIVTFSTNGPASANEVLLFRIPIPANAGTDLVVAVVDTMGKPITFLPAIGIEPGFVTVSTRVLDQALLQQIMPGPAPRTLSLVVLAIAPGSTLGQLYPSIGSDYQMGINDFEFRSLQTTFWSSNESGMVLTEWIAQRAYPAGINSVSQRAPGVWESNSNGIMLTADLSEQFDRSMGENYGPQWIASYHDADPDQYTRSIVNAVWWALLYNDGVAVPLALTDGSAIKYVLVLAWNSANQTFIVRDPAVPSTTQTISFAGSRMQPYADRDYPGTTYTIPYFVRTFFNAAWVSAAPAVVGFADPDFPSASAGVWPTSALSSWSEIRYGSAPTIPDTVYLVGDTTRVWTSTPFANVPVPSTLPLLDGWTIQGHLTWVRNAAGTYAPLQSASATSEFIDAKPSVHPDPWFEQTYGLVSFTYTTSDFSGFAWDAWRQVDVVRYAMEVDVPDVVVGMPATFELSSPGGPTLPAMAEYEWEFNDETEPVRQVGPGPITHTYEAGGPTAIDVTVYHPVTDQVIARTRVEAEVTGGFVIWQFLATTVSIDQAGASPFEGFAAGIASTWTKDTERWTDIRDSVSIGGLLYVPRDTVIGGFVRLRGLYLIDSPTFTAAHLNRYVRLPSNGSTSSGPFDERVRVVNLLHPSFPPRAADLPSLNQAYTETGSLTFGHIAGTHWRAAVSTFPNYISQVDLDLNGSTADHGDARGTITIIARSPEPDKPPPSPETRRWTIHVTFVASRIQ